MKDDLFSVDDQVVLVSGGSRGIGRAIAKGFADRGAKVIISSRSQESLAEAQGLMTGGKHEVETIVCDVAKRDDIDQLVGQIIDAHGYIDTLINVAGVNRRKPALDISEDDYDFVMDINLKGAYLLSLAVGRHMVDRGSGCHVNIASLNSDRPLKNVSPYAMSKCGMTGMTRALALEWGSRGVRVNALAPGFILTDLTQKLWSDPTMQAWGSTNTPQGRLGKPEDMVGTALFLACDASAFVTGQTIYVDGGFTAGWSWPIPE